MANYSKVKQRDPEAPVTRYCSLTNTTKVIHPGKWPSVAKRIGKVIKQVVYGPGEPEVTLIEQPGRRSVLDTLRGTGHELVVPARPDGVIDFTGRGDRLRHRPGQHVTTHDRWFRPRRRTFVGR